MTDKFDADAWANGDGSERRKPRLMKILILDIETAPHKVYAWGLWGQDIHINQIVEPGYTLCWAAKWRGKREVMFESVMGKGGPEGMMATIHALLEEADAVVHFNGKKFDMPTLNKEFLALGMDPPSHYAQVDLLRVARSNFKLASNKLDYVARFLGLGGKLQHKGMPLWTACMDGDERAWATMERYNKKDVRLTDRVYGALLPWIKGHPNHGLYVDSTRPTCRNCGSQNMVKNGAHRTATMAYQRYKCKTCGAQSRGRLRIAGGDPGITV